MRKTTMFLMCLLSALLAVGMYILATGGNPAPMSGRVTGLSSHPAYYPANALTPTVYVVGITDDISRRSCSWVVDADTYARYELGDQVRAGWR